MIRKGVLSRKGGYSACQAIFIKYRLRVDSGGAVDHKQSPSVLTAIDAGTAVRRAVSLQGSDQLLADTKGQSSPHVHWPTAGYRQHWNDPMLSLRWTL